VPSVCARRLRERRPARPDSVALLRDAAVRFARDHGATAGQRDDIALAVSEALTIGVLHAYVGHAVPGAIELRGSRSQGALVIGVCDRGNGLQARLDSREIGIGLALIHRVTERLEIHETEPGLLIRMTFAVA
jgi:anti-sigma regulatory factor (Ser/Thr protein kinase)